MEIIPYSLTVPLWKLYWLVRRSGISKHKCAEYYLGRRLSYGVRTAAARDVYGGMRNFSVEGAAKRGHSLH